MITLGLVRPRIIIGVVKPVLEHAKNHVMYPITKKELLETCGNFSDVPKAQKEFFEKNLPERIYKDVNEVIKALLDNI